MKIADERDEYIHLYESTLKDLDIAVKNKIELENMRKEAIKYVKEDWFVEGQQRDDYKFDKDLLNILNKGDKNE